MKILHSSDWHLGHQLFNDSQEAAQQNMLEQMVRIVSEQKPDVFLISGDVYDTTQPSAQAQQMFADAIVEIHRANESMTIVCIAGNHDSGSKHMIFHRPWKALNVHMIGNITRDSNLEDYIIKVADAGYVVAVPYAAERFMPDNVFVRLSDMVAERNSGNLPVVLMAHMAVADSDWRGHDFSSDTNIGGLNCQDLSEFGSGYDYVALGHIHRQQSLDADGRVWYSGTPIAVSFDEVYPGNEHGVLLAECPSHGAQVVVESVPIKNSRPLVNLPSEGSTDWDNAKELLSSFPEDIPAFIRLNVQIERYLPAGANDEAMKLIRGKQCRLSVINSKRKEMETNASQARTFTASEFRQLPLNEVARMWIEFRGQVFDQEMQDMLSVVIDRMKDNSND